MADASTRQPLNSSTLLYVVTPDRAEVADVEPPVRDYGIRPRLRTGSLGLIRRRESASLVIPFGGCLDQSHVAILPMDVQPAIREAYRPWANAAGVPFRCSRLELNALQGHSPGALKIVPDPDRAADRVGQFLGGVDGFRVE